MFGPKVVIADRTLLFDSNGDVAVMTGDQGDVRGHWRSQVDDGAPKQNLFHFDLDGIDQEPVPVTYSFSDPDNQLVAVLTPNGGTPAEAFAFAGGIEIDDNHDVIYRLIDSSNNPTGTLITVYGDLKFEEATENLVITTSEG